MNFIFTSIFKCSTISRCSLVGTADGSVDRKVSQVILSTDPAFGDFYHSMLCSKASFNIVTSGVLASVDPFPAPLVNTYSILTLRPNSQGACCL